MKKGKQDVVPKKAEWWKNGNKKDALREIPQGIVCVPVVGF